MKLSAAIFSNRNSNSVCGTEEVNYKFYCNVLWHSPESWPGSSACASRESARCRCLQLRPQSWTPPPRRCTRGRAFRSGRSSVFCPGRPAVSWARPRSRGPTPPSARHISPPCQRLAPAPGPSASGEPADARRCNSSMRNESLFLLA